MMRPRPAEELARPEIIVSDRQPDEIIDDALAALVAANAPPSLYVRGGHPVRILADEEGRPSIHEAGSDTLLERLYDAATWWRKTRKGFGAAEPPRRVAVAVRERILGRVDALPPLRGVVTSPVMRRDGSILATPGYDAESRLVYAPPAGVAIPAIPEAPTSTDISIATALVEEMLADFPFVADADRASACALLVGIVLREVIDGPVPLHVITAPSQGTGKGLLAEVIALAATGQRAAMSAMPEGRSAGDELRKRITAILSAGRPLAIIDNLVRAIDSPALAAVLTAERWTDRVLGASTEIELPNRCVWAAIGNNVTVRGDFARRVLWCRLDARIARPWLRDKWQHSDLLAWVAERRGELLAAVLTLGRGWIVAGRPGPGDKVPTLGGYDSWRHVVGGVLQAAGVEGLLGQAAEMYDAADEETPVWTAFLEAWRERWGKASISVAELVRVLEVESDKTPLSTLVEAVPPEVSAALATKRAGVRVGHALRRQAGKRFATEDGALWIERDSEDRHAKVIRWSVRCG